MSIIAYTGLPRHGKSYGVVENQILPALRAGRTVVTNIPLYVDLIREVIPTGIIVELPTQLVVDEPQRIFEFAVPGCLLVIDELWKVFPAGQKVSDVPQAFKTLLAEHGHMVNAAGDAMQIVLVTQDLAQVGAFARQLVEYTYRVVKLSTVGLAKNYRVDVFERSVTGPNPPMAKRIRAMQGKYSEKVWRFYKSHTISEASTDGANEVSLDQRFVIWKSPRFYIGMPLALIVMVGGLSVAWDKFHPSKPGAASVSSRQSVGSKVLTAPGGRVHLPEGRVTAWVVSDPLAFSFALLEVGDTSIRVPWAKWCRFGEFGEVLCKWGGGTYSSLARGVRAPPSSEGFARLLSGPPAAAPSGSAFH